MPVIEGAHETFYGMREFIIRDPNGVWSTTGEPETPPARAIGDDCSHVVDVEVSGTDGHAELSGHGEVIEPLRHESWDRRECGIRTPDGHRQMFGEPRAAR